MARRYRFPLAVLALFFLFGTYGAVAEVRLPSEAAVPLVRPAPALPLEPVTVRPAYPNPFKQATTLVYTLHEPRNLRVDVYDLLGHHVTTLAEGSHTAGEHRVTFQAGNLAPGLYLIRLETERYTNIQRVVHLR